MPSGGFALQWRMERRSTILLVEDSPDDVLFFERALREGRHDYDVHIARTARKQLIISSARAKVATCQVIRCRSSSSWTTMCRGIAGSDLLRWKNRIYGGPHGDFERE